MIWDFQIKSSILLASDNRQSRKQKTLSGDNNLSWQMFFINLSLYTQKIEAKKSKQNNQSNIIGQKSVVLISQLEVFYTDRRRQECLYLHH